MYKSELTISDYGLDNQYNVYKVNIMEDVNGDEVEIPELVCTTTIESINKKIVECKENIKDLESQIESINSLK